MGVPTPRPGFPDIETFVEVWDTSDSITAVSVALVASGYYRMTPSWVRRMGASLRAVGLRMKKMRRPALPAFTGDMKVGRGSAGVELLSTSELMEAAFDVERKGTSLAVANIVGVVSCLLWTLFPP